MKQRWWILILASLSIGLFFAFDLGRFFTLESLKLHREALQQVYAAEPLRVIGGYAAAYIVMAALSLPGATVMTLAGGAVFGLWIGVPVVLFAATIGATLAFWAARYVFRDAVQRRFSDRLESINKGLERDGAFYLFSLRLVPVFPFFLINLLMGLTAMRSVTFFWISLIGMFAGTVVYVNAGTQLTGISHLSDVMSLSLLASFLALALFPWLARKALWQIQNRRLYALWSKPTQFDRNLIVIGAGAAGLVSAYIAAAVRAKVTLIENHKMGGDCLNYGCVPSKALIRSAGLVHEIKNAAALGIRQAHAEYDFADVMTRVRRVIETVAPHDSVERYTRLGVEVAHGKAVLTSPWSVEVNGQVLTTRAIVIATGARPLVPKIPGLEAVRYYTSDTIWNLTERPQRLIVLGGGPIGCELAQAFARLDCEVTMIVRSDCLPREDEDAVASVKASLLADGVTILTHTETLRCEIDGDAQFLYVRTQTDDEIRLPFDALLCAVGRIAHTEGFGLEELGIPISSQQTIETDAWLQTLFPNIYACGDVAGPYQFTNTASHQAWYASVNALFGSVKRFKVDYSAIPRTTFTDPEIACVGLSETDAKARNIAYEITRFDLKELDRAITDEAANGFIKVLTVPGKDRILGVCIVSRHAGDLLAEFVLAMKHGLGLNKILSTIHTYPTWSEANKYVAGEWKRAHTPDWLLRWLEKYHTRKRGRN